MSGLSVREMSGAGCVFIDLYAPFCITRFLEKMRMNEAHSVSTTRSTRVQALQIAEESRTFNRHVDKGRSQAEEAAESAQICEGC